MKLVKESLNEFERGLDPKVALGIGRVTKIQNLFKYLDISDKDYKILLNGVIYNGYLFLKDKNVVWLPDGLQIMGNLNLENNPIKKLPKDLEINGWLGLNDTLITELPTDLYVKLYICVDQNQRDLIAFIKDSKFANKLMIWE
jgi:hypothetical protein